VKRKKPVSSFAPGDILWANKNYNKSGRRRHYIIYFSPHDTDPMLIIGAMLTTKDKYGNHKLQSHYFKYYDSKGYQCSVGYKNSLVASKKADKKVRLGNLL
jgi:hypothetical protein